MFETLSTNDPKKLNLIREINKPKIIKFESDNVTMISSIPFNKGINMAVSQMGALKYPGLDGYNAKFYQWMWEMVGPDIVIFIQNFFKYTTPLTKLNKTSIVPIPKKKYSKR